MLTILCIFHRFKPGKSICSDKNLRRAILFEGVHTRNPSSVPPFVPIPAARTTAVKQPDPHAGSIMPEPFPPDHAGRYAASSANTAENPARPKPFPPITGPIFQLTSRNSTTASAPVPVTARSAAISISRTALYAIEPYVSPADTSTFLTRLWLIFRSRRISPSTVLSPIFGVSTSPTTSILLSAQ